MQFTIKFTIDTEPDFIQYSTNNIPLATNTSDNCTWNNPFTMDGLSKDDVLTIDFCIETVSRHYYPLLNCRLKLNTLTFSKPRKRLNDVQYRRNSTHYYDKTIQNELYCIILQDSIRINYNAQKCNDFIILRISSILMPTPVEKISTTLQRTGTSIVLYTGQKNEVETQTVVCCGKATRIKTMTENNSRIYRWFFDRKCNVTSTHYEFDYKVYDADRPNAINEPLLKPLVKPNVIKFVRHVYFPVCDTGFDVKELLVKIKDVDYTACISRHNSLNAAFGASCERYTLERGIRQGILLKIEFDKDLLIYSLELHVENYPKNIEERFETKK